MEGGQCPKRKLHMRYYLPTMLYLLHTTGPVLYQEENVKASFVYVFYTFYVLNRSQLSSGELRSIFNSGFQNFIWVAKKLLLKHLFRLASIEGEEVSWSMMDNLISFAVGQLYRGAHVLHHLQVEHLNIF